MKMSQRSDMVHRLGAVIFNNRGQVINCDYNRWLFIGQKKRAIPFKTSIHAEQGAIVGCSRQELWGSSIYVYRANGALAKPCYNCEALIRDVGIRNIFYSDGNNGIVKL
jgi:deoxycytidylate deaminase